PSPISEGVIYVLTYRDMINHYCPPSASCTDLEEMPWREAQAFNQVAVISQLENISVYGIEEISSLTPTTLLLKPYFMEEVERKTQKVRSDELRADQIDAVRRSLFFPSSSVSSTGNNIPRE